MEEICMNRSSSSLSWGFRLQGGSDFCQRLTVQRVETNSLAAGATLGVGDCIIEIGGVKTEGLTHQQTLSAVRQSGNELRLAVVRKGNLFEYISGKSFASSDSSKLATQLEDIGLSNSISAEPSAFQSSCSRTLSVNSGYSVSSPGIVHQHSVSDNINPTASRYSPNSTGYTPFAPKPQPPQSLIINQHFVQNNQRAESPSSQSYRPVQYSPSQTRIQPFAQTSTISPTITTNLYSNNSAAPNFVPTPSAAPTHMFPGGPRQPSVEHLNGFSIPSREEVLNEQYNGTNITVRQGESFSAGFNGHRQQPAAQSPTNGYSYSNGHTGQNGNMNGNGQVQDEIPDQLLMSFANKRPEDKPFSYLPSGGLSELQQRQREVAPPPIRPKPRNPSRQSSYNSIQLDNNGNSAKPPAGYDAESLFTPAYKEMMKNQREVSSQPSPTALPAEMVGYGPGKVPHEDVAAYILQPDGTMAALRWNDRPGPDLQNSAVMHALMEEQNAQMQGTTSGRIQSASGSKQGLSFKVLQWLTGTDSEEGSETASNYSGSHDGVMHSPAGRRLKQQSFDSTSFPEKIREDENGNEFEHLYSGSNLPSKSFRRLLRSVSSTASTEEVNHKLNSPTQESPATSEGSRSRRNNLKNVSGSTSQDKTTPQTQPTEKVAYCDF